MPGGRIGRRDFLRALGLGAASLVVAGQAGCMPRRRGVRRPNIVFMMADDLGRGGLAPDGGG